MTMAEQPEAPAANGIKAFTTSRRPDIEFTLDGELYRAVGTCPFGVWERMVTARNQPGADQLLIIPQFLDAVLHPDSAERIAARLTGEGDVDPLGLEDILPVCEWLMERYADRPTRRRSSSPSG